MATISTQEKHKTPELVSRWYTNSYDEAKSAVLEIAKGYGYSISNINDQFAELFLLSNKYSLVVKITSLTPRETSVDFHLVSKGLLDFGKGKKHVIEWYAKLDKKLRFKGVGLHP